MVRKLHSEEGTFSFWKGTGPSLMRVVPGAGLYFYIMHLQTTYIEPKFLSSVSGNSNFKQQQQQQTTTVLNNFFNFWLGASSRFLAGALLAPVNVVKTRFEAKNVKHESSTIGTLRQIAKTEGIRGLWNGYIATVVRDVPFSGFYVLFYSNTRHFLANSDFELFKNGKYRDLQAMLSGGTAGIAATILTHPQDVLKTRLQIQSLENSNSVGKELGKSRYLTVLNQIVKERAFFRGLLPRLLRRPFQAMITWTLFERLLGYSPVH